jgi:hypothetical protein
VDVGFQVSISFLVWGYQASSSTAGCNEIKNDDDVESNNEQLESGRSIGALLKPSGDSASLEESVDQTRKNYEPLLLALGRTWPGFCHALLVHLVDFLLITETSTNDELSHHKERTLCCVSFWIRFLLSRSFLSLLCPSTSSTKGIITEASSSKKRQKIHDISTNEDSFLAPLSVLQKQMEYPLNSICDRLRQQLSVSNPSDFKTSRELEQLFLETLGESRQVNFGVELPHVPQDKPSLVEIDGACNATAQKSSESTTSPAAHRIIFSLAELETMLSEGGEARLHKCDSSANSAGLDGRSSKNVPDQLHESKRPAWVKCKSWEPCAIGALPGYPV